LGAVSPIFDRVLKEQGWPTRPANPRSFSVDDNPLCAAAQALALLAYPTQREQQPEGPAHKFCAALLADMFRLSRSIGKVQRMPTWVSDLRTETMRGRIGRGERRLSYRLAVMQVVFEAANRAEERRARLAGEKRTFALRFSPDFRQLVLDIPVRMTPDGSKYEMIGSVPETRQSSLRAAIIDHREAFGKGAGDPQVEYANIHHTYFRPTLPMFGLLLVVWEALMAKAREASERKLTPTEILMRQPEWAAELPRKVRERQGMALRLLHDIGVSSCSCWMLEIA
jgi:hypothetical protein